MHLSEYGLMHLGAYQQTKNRGRRADAVAHHKEPNA